MLGDIVLLYENIVNVTMRSQQASVNLSSQILRRVTYSKKMNPDEKLSSCVAAKAQLFQGEKAEMDVLSRLQDNQNTNELRKRLKMNREASIASLTAAIDAEKDPSMSLLYRYQRHYKMKEHQEAETDDDFMDLDDEKRRIFDAARQKREDAIVKLAKDLAAKYKPTLRAYLREKLKEASNVTKQQQLVLDKEGDLPFPCYAITPPPDMRDHLPFNAAIVLCAREAVSALNEEYLDRKHNYYFHSYQEACEVGVLFYPEFLVCSVRKRV
jgi:hypothetical protein